MKPTFALALLASLAQASPLGQSSTKIAAYNFAEEKCSDLGLDSAKKSSCFKDVGLLKLKWEKAKEFVPKFCTDEVKAKAAKAKVDPLHGDRCGILEDKAQNGEKHLDERLDYWRSQGSRQAPK